jgi:folate-dependent phosphoribosylglycinamide formyltransferase PurN
MTISPLFSPQAGRIPNIAVFMSGSGSNAEQLIQFLRKQPSPFVQIQAIVTDNPSGSRASELGKLYGLPVIAHDIRAFYAARGERRVSIATPAGQRIREEWTDSLRELIRPLALDFAVFAGFVPLTNISRDLPCLNVHPGDLTYEKDGVRQLVGLHTLPIERAIIAGLDYLRSSVIVVQPYDGAGNKEMDSGALLGVSPKVPVDFQGETPEALRDCAARRPAQRPKGGWGDRLEEIALHNQELLKRHGDWIVLPPCVKAFAEGRYATDEAGALYFDGHGTRTVEFPSGTLV